MFQDAAEIDRKHRLLLLAGRGPHIAVGVSLGPFKSIAAERSCARLLDRLSFIGVRDEESFDIACSLTRSTRTKLTFDLAPLLPLLGGSTRCSVRARPPEHERCSVGFALCDYERFSGGDRERDAARRAKIARLAAALDPLLVDQVVFFEFNGHADYGDREISEHVASAVPPGIAVRHVRYKPDPLAVLDEISRLRVMVAVRLHAAVFSYVAGVPAVILGYHPKCLGWARQIGHAPAYVHDSIDFDPAAVASQIAAIARGVWTPPALELPEAQRLAALNFSSIAGCVALKDN